MGGTLRPETLGQPNIDPTASLPGTPSADQVQGMMNSFPVSLKDVQSTNQQLQTIQGNHVTQAANQIQQIVQPVPPPTAGSAIQQTASQQMQNASDDVFSQISKMGTNELQGRAQALGMDNPGAYSDQQLQQFIMSQRAQVRPDHAGALATLLAPLAEFGVTLANLGLRTGDQLAQIRGDIWGTKYVANGLGLPSTESNAAQGAPPYVQDILEHGVNRQQAQTWLANLDEGVRSSLTPEQNQQLFAFSGMANIAGGIAIAAPVFEGASALLSIPIAGSETGLIASPTARAAVAGAATALGLYAGSDAPMLPSSKDFSTMLDGSASTPDRVAAAMNVIGGNRLVGTILGGALGSLSAKGKQAFPDGTDLGDNMSNDPANDPTSPAPPQQALGPSVAGTAYEESWSPQPAGTQWEGAPQGTPVEPSAPDFNNFRALPAGTQAAPTGGIEGVDWQIEPNEPPQTNAYGQRLLRPPLRPGAQSTVDFASTAIGDAYRAVGLNDDPRIQAMLADMAQQDHAAYGDVIQNVSNNPDNWDRRASVPQAGDWNTAGMVSDIAQPDVQPMTAPVAPTEPLRLTGPLNPATQSVIDGYHAQASIYESDMHIGQQNGMTPDAAAQFQRQIDSYRKTAFELGTNPNNRLTSSPADVSSKIVDLRIQQAFLQTAYDNKFADLDMKTDDWGYKSPHIDDPERSNMLQQLADADYQIATLMKSAGLNKFEEPNLWDVMRDNPLSPVTPGRQVVDNYGTVVRNKDGSPTVMYHGTAAQFPTFDVSMTSPNGLGGSGIYLTNNPLVAGGNPGDVNSEYGYANARADDIKSQQAELKYQRDAAQGTVDNFERRGPAGGISPEAYQLAKQTVNNYPAALAALQQPAPNVHMVYAAIKRPFNFDGPISMEDGLKILQVASEHPNVGSRQLDWNKVADSFKEKFTHTGSYNGAPSVIGQDLYYDMLGATPVSTNGANGITYDLDAGMTRDLNNEILQNAGYDALKFGGGNRSNAAGNMQHDAYNVFDPKHVVPVYLSEPQAAEAAEQLGTTLYKKEIIQQTTALPALAAKSVITDADVVKAEVTANPGGFHLVRNISNIPELMRGLQEQLQGGTVKAFRPVVGPSGGTDLLVSSLGEITDKMAADYQKWGLFPNQDVISSSGKEGKVVRLDDNNHVWRSARQRGKQVSNAAPGTLTPKTSGTATVEAEPLWQVFRQYAVDQTAARINSSGQPYVPENGIFDLPVQERLQNLTTTFLNEAKISDVGTRAAIQRYFDMRMIDESKTLDPDAWAKHDVVADMSSNADPVAEAMDRVPDIYAHGALRGFNVVPNEGKPGYMLEDIISDRKIPFNDEEGVRNFLNTYNRQMPDATPFSPVPLEAGDWSNDSMMHQTEMHADDWEAHLGNDIQGMLDEPMEMNAYNDGSVDQVPAAGTSVVRKGFTSSVGSSVIPITGANFTLPDRAMVPDGSGSGASGGGSGGSEPPRAIGGGSDEPSEPNGGRGEMGLPLDDIRSQLANMEPHDVTEMMRIHQNLIMRMLSPMRNVFARMEEQFYQNQVGGVRPYDTFQRIASGLDLAHNDYQPTIKKTAQLLSYIDVKKLRRGGAYRIMEISDPSSRIQEAVKQGWSPTEVAKLGQAINTLKAYIGKDAYGQVMQFVQRTRTMQARGDFSSAPYGNATDFPLAAFFRDHAIDTRMNFQTVDPRNLFRAVARSYGFAKMVGQDWNDAYKRYTQIAQTPDSMGGRAFAQPAKVMLDWLDYVQRGPKPGSDAIQNGIQQAFGAVGIRLRTNEVRGFLGNLIGEFWLAKLAFRPDIIFRDSFQPALAIPYVGLDNMATSMGKSIAFGSDARKAMMQSALDNGFIQIGTHRIDAPSSHGQMPLLDSRGIPVDPNFSVPDMSKRASIANVGDFLRDLRPPPLRGKVTPNTMGGADMVWDWGRVIAGDAAISHFNKQIAGFTAARDAAIQSGNLANMPNSVALMHALNADNFMPAVARGIQRMVDAGDIDGARRRYAQNVVDETQFTYGAKHAPQAIRGTFARMAYAGGTWSQQTLSFITKAIRYGYKNPKFLASVLALMAGHDALMEYLKKTTGWNFRKWELWSAATYGGGAILSGGASALAYVQGVQGLAASQGPQDLATGAGLDDPRRGDLETVDHVNIPGAVLGAAFNTFNRFKGLEGLIGGLYDASGAARPGNAAADAIITGEKYPASVQSQFDMEQQFQNAGPGGIYATPGQGSVVQSIRSPSQYASPIFAPPERTNKWSNNLPGGHAQQQVTPGAYPLPVGNNPGYGAPMGTAEANFMGALQQIPESQRAAAIAGFQQSQRAAGQQPSVSTGHGGQ